MTTNSAYRAMVEALQEGELKMERIQAMSVAELQAGMSRWQAERAGIEAAWQAVDHLPYGHPEREAVAGRDGLSRLAIHTYEDELLKAHVDDLRAKGDTRGELVLAMGLGLIHPDQW